MKSLFCLHSVVKVAKLHHSLLKDKDKRNTNLRLRKHNPDFGVSKLTTGVAIQTISFIWPSPSPASKRKINCSQNFSNLNRSSQWLHFFPFMAQGKSGVSICFNILHFAQLVINN